MTDEKITTPILDRLEAVARAAIQGRWRWHWRDDKDAPGSIYAMPREGHAYAVAMCPRYGKDDFEANAAHISAFDPPTALKLLAVVRAAKEVAATSGCGIQELTDLSAALQSLEKP